MKTILIIPAIFTASQAMAGGWEASKLDTSFMYKDGGFADFSYASLDYNVKANATSNGGTLDVTGHKTAKSQTRPTFSLKMGYGDFDFGVTSFTSGNIQMQGGAGSMIDPAINFVTGLPTVAQPDGATFVPDADASLNSLTVMGKYSFSDRFDVLLGATQNSLNKSTISTILGTYEVEAKTATSSVLGAAFSKPEIALRVELLFQPKSTIKANSDFTKGAAGDDYAFALSSGAITIDNVADFTTTLSRPETMTLNFQSGIASDTLLYGSIHRASWKSSQITVATGNAVSNVESEFTDTTALSLGVARKVNEQLALTASLSSEDGGGKTSTSLFTQSNGSQGISLGARYTIDNITISGGYNYTNVGDVTVSSSAGVQQAVYKNNNVSAIGLKIGFAF